MIGHLRSNNSKVKIIAIYVVFEFEFCAMSFVQLRLTYHSRFQPYDSDGHVGPKRTHLDHLIRDAARGGMGPGPPPPPPYGPGRRPTTCEARLEACEAR